VEHKAIVARTFRSHNCIWYDPESSVENKPLVSYSWGMKLFIAFVLWCLLLVVCWPLAILALVVYPFVWLISLPLRLIGITIGATFALIRALLFLPARIFGVRPRG
jgi:hypothetical protein